MTLTLSARIYLFVIALFLAGFFFCAIGALGIVTVSLLISHRRDVYK